MELVKDKVIVVIGATGGMGKVLSDKLAEQGAKLVLSSTKEEELGRLCGRLEKTYGTTAVGMVLDAVKEEQVETFMGKAGERFGAIDALINLAGVSIPGKIAETSEETYDLMMDVNVKSFYLVSKYLVKYAAKDAHIINIGSMAGRRVNGNAPLYCVAKSAVNTLAQGLALQLASQGIHVTTLNPGGADTPFWGNRRVSREKMLLPQDIVDVILFVLNCNPRISIHSIDFESMQMIG